MTLPLIIDCDPGHDDAVAILTALQHADVLGITTVAGNAPLDHVTRNTLALLELADIETPVHSGAAQALAGTGVDGTHVHGATGFGGVELPQPTTPPASDAAVDFLLGTANNTPGLWIAAIGPLTNLALAVRRDPTFAQRLAGISIMGGSTTSGNTTPTAEFNILADPEAAQAVFESGANLKMCGLNLTRQLMTDDTLIEQLRGRGRVADLVAELHEHIYTRLQTLTGERRAALHDPCAILAITHPELFDFTPRHVAVELQGTLTRGMTVADERPTLNKAAPNVDVAYRIDADAALRIIVDAVLHHP